MKLSARFIIIIIHWMIILSYNKNHWKSINETYFSTHCVGCNVVGKWSIGKRNETNSLWTLISYFFLFIFDDIRNEIGQKEMNANERVIHKMCISAFQLTCDSWYHSCCTYTSDYFTIHVHRKSSLLLGASNETKKHEKSKPKKKT